MNLASRSARGALILSATNVLSIAIGFLGGVVLARLLGPNDFGTYALALTLVGFADLRSKLQLEQKYLSDQDARPLHLNTFYTLNVLLAIVSFVGLLAAAAIIVWLGRSDLALSLAIIGIVGLFDPLGAAIRLSIEKQVSFGRVAVIQSAANIVQFAATLVAALLGAGLWSLLIGYAVNTLLNLALFARIAPDRPQLQLDRSLARDFIRYGLRYGVVFATSLTILTQFDNFIVGLLRGTAELGYYDRAYRTSLWPTLLFSASLGRVTLPTYSLMRDNPQQLGRTYSLVLWSVLSFTTPLAIVFLLTASDLVPVLYGPRWLPAVPLLQALAAFSVFRTMLDDVRSILVATDRSQLFARVMFWQALLMVVLVVPLTYFYGSVGTAVAVGVAFFLSTIFVHYFGYTQLHINLVETSLLPVLNNLLALVAYLIIWPWLPTGGLAAWERLSLEIVLIVGLYVAISLLTSRRLIVSRLGLIWRSLRASS